MSKSLALTITSLTLAAFNVACGGPVEREPIAGDTVRDFPTREEPTVQIVPAAFDVLGVNADRTQIILITLEIEDVSALPTREDIAVDPDGPVRATMIASGDMPVNSDVCDRIDNPLPEDVNPCARTVTLYETPPTPLAGVVTFTSTEDVVSGQVEAFLGEDDVVYANFSERL